MRGKKEIKETWVESIFWRLVIRISTSPVVIFLLLIFLLDQNLRVSLLITLYYFTAKVILGIVLRIIDSAWKSLSLNFLGLSRNTFQIVAGVFLLVSYWFSYLTYYGMNFELS